MDVNRAEQI